MVINGINDYKLVINDYKKFKWLKRLNAEEL